LSGIIVFSLFAAVVAIQFIFYLFIFLRISFYQNENTEEKSIPITVIICAHDEINNLKELIPILLNQNYPEFEVIVVEDRSNDETYDYLLEETKKFPNLKMVRVEHLPAEVNPKKYALTLGIKGAKHEHVLLTDADCRPTSASWIAEMSKGFSGSKEIVLGISPYRREKGFLNLFTRFETLYTIIQYLSFALSGIPYMGVGRNLAYTKSLFLKNKGFNNHMRVTGGDDDLFVNETAKNNNVSIVISPESKMISFPKKTWKEWKVQKKRHLSVGKHYKFKFKLILGLLSFSQIFFWIFFILSLSLSLWPIATLGLFFAKVLGMVVIFSIIFKKLNERMSFVFLPFLDLVYSIYFVTIGASALLSKKNKWK
jgi:glycosyltransferase involved in cell wall biosynthesis